jgi:hypothetical protein
VFVEPSGRNIVFIGLLKTWPLGDEFFFLYWKVMHDYVHFSCTVIQSACSRYMVAIKSHASFFCVLHELIF